MADEIRLEDIGSRKGPDYSSQSINEFVSESIQKCDPKNGGYFNGATVNAIVAAMTKGVSFTSACMAAGLPPNMGKRWMTEGMKDFESITDDQIDDADGDFDSIVSEKAKFYLLVQKAKGECILTMHNALYDRIDELPWVPQWFLTVLEPEVYNLKYRMFKESQEQQNNGGSGEITFIFENGKSMRDPDDRQYVEEKLTELKEQYKDSDMKIAKRFDEVGNE